jgi:hypothetical protein
MSMGSTSSSITSIPGGVAVMWNEGKPFTDPTMGLLYMPTGIVSTYNGTQWIQLDDKVNSDYPGIATDARDAEQLHPASVIPVKTGIQFLVSKVAV